MSSIVDWIKNFEALHLGVKLRGDTMTGNLIISKADPTLTLTDTGDSNSATWARADTSALVSHKNTAQEGGVAYGLDYDTNTDTTAFATTALFDGNVSQTISFWIKTTQQLFTAAYFGVLSKFSGTDNQRSYNLRYRDVGVGNNRLSLNLRDSALVYNPSDEWILTTEINDGNWHHIVLSWDYSTGICNLYVDTVKIVNVTTLDQTKTQYAGGTNKAVELGSEKWIHASLLAQYDEMAIWQRKLTDAEVGDLYNSGIGFYITTSKTFASTGTSMGTNLVGLWHMDENTGTTIADSSTSGITGTFGTTNPAWTTGLISSDGTDYEVTYLSHQDGGSGIRGRTDLGNTLGDTYINGKTTYLQIAGTNEWTLTAAGLYPSTNDGSSVGISGNAVSDIFLATGAVINFNAGAETITHSANTLTFGGITLFDMATGIFEMNDAVRFDTGVAMVAASYSIGRDADGTNQLHLNVPTGATFEWSVNDVAQMTLSASTLALPVSGSIISLNAGNVLLTHSANALNLTANSVNLADLTSTGYVFNEGGADIDMRWESDTNANMFGMDAGLNMVYIGGNTAISYTVDALLQSPANSTKDYVLYVDRVTNTVPIASANGVTRYSLRSDIASAVVTSSTYPNNITALAGLVDQQTTKTVGWLNGNQVTEGMRYSVRVDVGQTGTGWAVGQHGNPYATGGIYTVQDYYGDTSDISDTRQEVVGAQGGAAVVSYTINKASGFIVKTYYGAYGSSDHRGGTLTAGSLTKNSYGGYIWANSDAVGTDTTYGIFAYGLNGDTNYSGYFGGAFKIVDYSTGVGTLSVDRGIIGNETGVDSDSRFEGDTATNLLVCDAGLDAVQIGTTTAGVIADFRTASIVFNEDGTAERDFRMEGDTDTDLLHIDTSTDSFGIGASAPDTKLEIQTGATWGKQAVTIDQDDVDQAFIDFQGTSSADLTNNISTFATEGGTVNYIKMEINGVAFWVRACTAPTA